MGNTITSNQLYRQGERNQPVIQTVHPQTTSYTDRAIIGNLNDNHIHADGGKYFGRALKLNR